MEFHRITKGCDKVLQMGEVVLISGEERNLGKWMKGRVLRYVDDEVIRGAIVCTKGIITSNVQFSSYARWRSGARYVTLRNTNAITEEKSSEERRTRMKRQAARDPEHRIKEFLEHEDE